MTKRLLSSMLLTCCMVVMLTSIATGQSLRPQRGFYIAPKIGLTSFNGDADEDLLPTFGRDAGPPWAAGGEIGYTLTPRFHLGGQYIVANFPTIVPTAPGDWYSRRHLASLVLRYIFMAPDARIAPYLETGLTGVYGQTIVENGQDQDKFGIGPFFSAGLDAVLTDRMSAFLQLTTNLSVPDDGADGLEGQGRMEFDMLNYVPMLGLRFSFKSAYTPAEVLSINCIQEVIEDQSATFTATVAESSQPVRYSWNFGDGTTADGLTVSHTFANPGTYTVTFTATGPRGDVSTQTCAVVVTRACVPPEIVSVNANPRSVTGTQSINFSANVRGDTPVTYSWDMGDGSGAHTGANPVHSFPRPGTYNVRLTATNACGTDTETITVTVAEEQVRITELNPVYFDRNSSTLDQEAIDRLAENVELLRQNPDLCVRIEGYAAPGERNPQRLSEQRARAAEQYYINNGIAPNRIRAIGMGVDTSCNAKEDSRRCRRVESIPVPCADLNR